MRFLHSHALPALQIPPTQRAVTAPTDQQFPTGNPAQRRDHPRMRLKGMHTLPAVYLPHEELSAFSLPLAFGASSQARAIPAPGYTRNGSMMPRQLQ
jgi:hypothetical protein